MFSPVPPMNRVSYQNRTLGSAHTTGMVATGAGFAQFEERGANCSELLERRATTK